MKNLTETIENMIRKQNVSFISSVDEDGYPNTKAMLAPIKQEGIKTFYWHTNSLSVRIKQYRNKKLFGKTISPSIIKVDGIAEILFY